MPNARKENPALAIIVTIILVGFFIYGVVVYVYVILDFFIRLVKIAVLTGRLVYRVSGLQYLVTKLTTRGQG